MLHLIHGIRTEPISPVKGLMQYLAGFEVSYPEYGYELALETRLVNPMLIGTLLPYIKPDDILVGHSNGCAIAYGLLEAGAPASRLAFINGALTTSWTLPEWVKSVDVYYNPGDDVTQIAQIGEELHIYPQNWGELGHLGYTGIDPRVSNFNCGATSQMPIVSGHSDFFTPEKLKIWGPFLANRLKSQII